MIATAIVVRVRLGAPILFKQKRPGLHGKPFYLYKFRTMTDERDVNGKLLPDSIRLTTTGKWIRKLSLDELPQLFNVLKGELSLVGPRPLLMEYLPLYSKEQIRRHEAIPGITGWAQINGRNAISWEDKFALDVWYVEHKSFMLDLKIIFLTFIKVFKREGINQDDHVTVEKFSGNFNQGELTVDHIVLIGAGGHSNVIQDIVNTSNSMKVSAILDDRFNETIIKNGVTYGPIHFLNDINKNDFKFCIAIGNNKTRKRLYKSLNIPLDRYATIIHPSAIISPSVKIGNGTVIMPGVVINADAEIEAHCIVNTCAVVEHDNIISSYAHISPNSTLAGTVKVGEGTQVGAGATVIQGKSIGNWSTIGAGAVVVENVTDNITVVGVPAKMI